MKNKITFNNKEFPLRNLNLSEFGEVSISTEDLNFLIMNDSNYISEEAKIIDEEIFYYVPNETINKSDRFIKIFIMENL